MALSGCGGNGRLYQRYVQPFCASCSRLRLTADGNVRPCLFGDAEYSVREALRRGDDMQVLSIWRDAVAHKPQEHAIIEGTQRFMSQIGG
ncbi:MULTISPECIES: hypothetical protein [unclassified Collinsella]|uniref:hypothetical protein n=1 Tax=unclassified Collinsella TaxID=2637548 RepID=UPI001F3F9131|nr:MULTISPECIES: hypothetical protein [unclassified Collinsella]